MFYCAYMKTVDNFNYYACQLDRDNFIRTKLERPSS